MARSIGAAKSPWTELLIAAGAVAVVSVVAVAKGWSVGSWIWAVAICAITGAVWCIQQMVRNRRLDRVVERARATDNKSESGQGPR